MTGPWALRGFKLSQVNILFAVKYSLSVFYCDIGLSVTNRTRVHFFLFSFFLSENVYYFYLLQQVQDGWKFCLGKGESASISGVIVKCMKSPLFEKHWFKKKIKIKKNT